MSKDFTVLQKKLGLSFNDPSLLEQAFVHRSYLNENRSFPLDHNERLEFLGDAVLELVVTEYLYLEYQNPEGELTNWRASLVNAKILSKITRGLGVEEYLYLSKGESKDTGKAREYILANVFESLTGAIYLDQGFEAAKKFIYTNVLVELPEILENKSYLDPKTKFQEAAQEKVGVTPVYKVLSESGPDHDKIFEIGVYLKKDLIASGNGSSKQEAQEAAALAGLEKMDW